MSVKSRPHTKTISELVEGIKNGVIGLPDFQRKYVWGPDDVVKLLDSIFKGYSVSSLLFIEGLPKGLNTKCFEGQIGNECDEYREIVLDGQQRLTAFFTTCEEFEEEDVAYEYFIRFFGDNGIIKNVSDNISGDESKEISYDEIKNVLREKKDDIDFEEYLRWDRGGKATGRYKGEYRLRKEEAKDEYIEISQISKNYVGRIKTEYAHFYKKGVKELTQREETLISNLITNLRDILMQYSMPVVYITDDQGKQLDIGTLTESFSRVNRTGIELDSFDIAVAMFHELGLRELWENSYKETTLLKDFNIKGWLILQVIALRKSVTESEDGTINTMSNIKEKFVFNELKDDFTKEDWEKSVLDLYDVLNYMDENLGCRHKSVLNKYILTVILALWKYIEKLYEEEKRDALNLLNYWYWYTTLVPGRTPSGSDWPASVFRMLIRSILNRKYKINYPKIKEGDYDLLIGDVTKDNIANLIFYLSEKDISGEIFDRNDIQYHHIFPKEWMGSWTKEATDSDFNFIPIHSKLNKIIKNKPPNQYLITILRENHNEDEEKFNKILKSNILPKYGSKDWEKPESLFHFRERTLRGILKDIL